MLKIRYSIMSLLTAAVITIWWFWSGPAEEPPENPAVSPKPSMGSLFEDVTAKWGVSFRHRTGATGEHFFPEIMGAGAALLDFDRDGDLDVYFVNSGTHALQKPAQKSSQSRNELYEQTGPGEFQRVTSKAGVGDTGYGMGVSVGDVNNDGYPDIYVTNFGPDRLFLNHKNGTFREISASAGIANPSWGTSAAFVDYDGDGWLDLFVTNYVDYAPRPCPQLSGAGDDYCAPHLFRPTSDKLFRNLTGESADGSVRFEDVTLEAGISTKKGPGLGVACADFTGDQKIDIFVANDQAANFLWVNQGSGAFREEAVLYGVANGADGAAQASMGVGLADINRDQKFDLFLTHLRGENNALHLQGPGFGFDERAGQTGLGIPSLPMTGFGTALVDLDHDGWLDVLIANGGVKRPSTVTVGVKSAGAGELVSSRFWDPYRQKNQIYKSVGKGRLREYLSKDDPFLAHRAVSRSLVVGDLDNDGDLDVLITNTNEAPQLLRNRSPKQGHWLTVSAVDPAHGGRFAYGAVIQVVADTASFSALVNPCRGYLSCHDPRVHFGLGDVSTIQHISVLWPDGTREKFPGSQLDGRVTLKKGRGVTDAP